MEVRSSILVVDDDAGIRDLLQRLLVPHGYVVVPARDGTEALRLVAEVRPDLLLLDVTMPEVDGLTVCRQLRRSDGGIKLPIVLMTAMLDAEDLWRGSGADAVLRKPFNQSELLSWVRCLLHARRADKDYEHAEAALVAMAAVIETRSLHSEDHPRRVARYSAWLAGAAGAGDDATAIIRRAALLHDIGEIGVPEAILGKPGLLRQDEFEQVKRHAAIGAELCGTLRDGAEISVIVRGHHEHWDGMGYPDGLAGEAIPLGARIVAVADALEALTKDRPYRRALSLDEALEVLWFGAEQQWDARLIESLERILHENWVAFSIDPLAGVAAGRRADQT